MNFLLLGEVFGYCKIPWINKTLDTNLQITRTPTCIIVQYAMTAMWHIVDANFILLTVQRILKQAVATCLMFLSVWFTLLAFFKMLF